jgi:hypothetical protein
VFDPARTLAQQVAEKVSPTREKAEGKREKVFSLLP